jgi:glycosyltransferase involved in cell wall biosynthesis
MDLSDITVMILTCNEQANLRTTLNNLPGAVNVLIVDSYSDDGTLEVAAEFPCVKVVQRRFDHFADQCNYGIKQIRTSWVLSLDADYQCGETFMKELATIKGNCDAYRAEFRYGIFGQARRGSLYPPRVVLYRRDRAHYEMDGHAQRVRIDGSIGEIKATILHDHRKPLHNCLGAQTYYARQEAEKLESCAPNELIWKDRIRRKVIFAPFLTLAYCLFSKRLILDGWRGVFYAFQRSYAELLLSLTILDQRLRHPKVNAHSPLQDTIESD